MRNNNEQNQHEEVVYYLLPRLNLSSKENEDKGTKGDHVARGTWDLLMLDLLNPGRVVGRDLGKKTPCFFRCYQNAMPREFQKELCRKPIWTHLKR